MRHILVLHSIGDILFCEPIYRHFYNLDGIKPKVIIRDHLMNLQPYIDSAEFVPASKWGGDIDTLEHNKNFINLRFANQIYRGYDKWYHGDYENCMLDKYRLLGLSEDLWKRLDIRIFFKGNFCNLFHDYALFNPFCQAGNISFEGIFYDGMHVLMNINNSFTVIDWWEHIKSAKENHHVSTSTFFLMQAIKNKFPEWNSPCYIYPRPNEDGLRGISQLHPDFNLIRVEK